MKITIFLFISALFTSCTYILPTVVVGPPVKTTHQQYMSNFNTKRDVVGNYGAATNKQIEEGIEIWYYDLGETAYSKTNVGTYNNNNNAYGRTTTTYSDKYVEFQFYENSDKVIRWRSNGVNYAEKKFKDGYYPLLWTGLALDFTAYCLILIGLLSY